MKYSLTYTMSNGITIPVYEDYSFAFEEHAEQFIKYSGNVEEVKSRMKVVENYNLPRFD